VRLLKFNADEKGINLSVHIDKKITGFLIGDPYRLNQIVTNLLNNAIKFTEKGYVKIEVEQINKEAEQVELLFKVIDTGIGISLNGSKKLFKEFSQTESSTTRKFGGTGLGLAICSNLVSLMGGEIGVNSTFGEGSEFWFRLKFSYLEKQKTIIKKDNFIVPGTLKILCAEDNMVNQRVTQLLLKNIGTECEIAENGKMAYEMAQKMNFDIILMDMQMPVIDGIESTCKIREYEALNKAVKPAYIVAVTANATSEDRQKCLSAGMNDFLSKPFQASELINIIKNVVSNS
jgi:two-component system, sensor histidine kinase